MIDGVDRRIAKKVNGVIFARYIWQDQLKLVAETNPNGSIKKQFVYAEGVNSPEYMVYEGKRYLFVKDHRGSVEMVVDVNSGEVKQRIKYSEFGEVLQDTNPGFQPFGFAGGLYDPDTKLVRFGARDYDGRIGRWLSKDPIRFNGGDPNLYGYVLNDPVNLTDSNGQNWWDDTKRKTNDFLNDVVDATKEIQKYLDEIEAMRKAAYCKMFPDKCGEDPAEKPIPEDPDINPKNQCKLK